uniref:Uncharacterized protein n=1 Tax=Magallana gigas TaxID=29159 RepID=K1RM31_MAGGI
MEWKANWEEANERCKSQNDSLVSIKDIKNHHSLMMGDSSIWSSVKGTFTPWIAYRGCRVADLCGGHKCHNLNNNTVGNCYFECYSKNNKEGGCAGTENFSFGLRTQLIIRSITLSVSNTLSNE